MQADIQFKEAMLDIGLEPPSEIIPDGDIHRFGKNKNAWYVFHNDNIPAGAFGNWKTGLSDTWKEDKEYSPEEKTAFKQRMDAIIKQREAEKEKQQAEAKQTCIDKWNKADSSVNHDYLVSKQVKAYGLKQSGNNLLTPVRKNKELTSLQTISPNGEKLFHPGGEIKGGYHVIGKPTDIILIGEGYATLASAYEASNYCSVVAFNAGNLKPVAETIRSMFPDNKIIILADNDQFSEGNPGTTKATEASKAIGAYIAIPQFKDTSNKPTDFNDLHYSEGLAVVKQQIESALNTEPEEISETKEGAIQRLSKLSPMKYESVRKEEAKKLDFRPNILDKLVKEAQPKDEENEVGGREVAFNDCEMFDGEVIGYEALNETLNHITRHMHINLHDAVISALWSAHTHIYNKFNHTPRLIISAPEPECGKTVLLFHMIGNFSNKVLPTDNLSPAVFFRLAEKYEPTFLIDEGDVFINQDSDLIAGFNNGFEPHGGVYRCAGDDHEVRKFPTYAPLALAGIQLEKKLPPATKSRAFIIHLERVGSEIADGDSWDKDIHRNGLLNSRKKLAKWMHDNKSSIATLKPALPHGLKNRSKDKWTPLFSIAQVAGGEWPARVLDAYNKSIHSHEPTKSEQFLIDVQSVLPEAGNIHTEALIEKLCGMEDSKYKEYNFKAFESEKKKIQPNQISNFFKKYKVERTNVRVHGSLKKGYRRKDLDKIIDRYTKKILSPTNTIEKGVTREQINGSKGCNDISGVTPELHVTPKNWLKPKPSNESYPVTPFTTQNTEVVKNEVEF